MSDKQVVKLGSLKLGPNFELEVGRERNTPDAGTRNRYSETPAAAIRAFL
jgi:hypothetical protein